jgi:hypothetical protein
MFIIVLAIIVTGNVSGQSDFGYGSLYFGPGAYTYGGRIAPGFDLGADIGLRNRLTLGASVQVGGVTGLSEDNPERVDYTVASNPPAGEYYHIGPTTDDVVRVAGVGSIGYQLFRWMTVYGRVGYESWEMTIHDTYESVASGDYYTLGSDTVGRTGLLADAGIEFRLPFNILDSTPTPDDLMFVGLRVSGGYPTLLNIAVAFGSYFRKPVPSPTERKPTEPPSGPLFPDSEEDRPNMITAPIVSREPNSGEHESEDHGVDDTQESEELREGQPPETAASNEEEETVSEPVVVPSDDVSDYFHLSGTRTYEMPSEGGSLFLYESLVFRERDGPRTEFAVKRDALVAGSSIETHRIYAMQFNEIYQIGTMTMTGAPRRTDPPMLVLSMPPAEWRYDAEDGERYEYSVERGSVTADGVEYPDAIVVTKRVFLNRGLYLTETTYYARGIGEVLNQAVSADGESLSPKVLIDYSVR